MPARQNDIDERIMKTLLRNALCLKALMVCLFIISLTEASSQTPFYQGKTITLISGVAAGGSGDIRIRALLPFLRKKIPGNPTLVVENMTGAGGRKAANHLYSNARPDGLTIGVLAATAIPLEVLKESGVMYDSSKFIYLGASEHAFHTTFFTRREAGFGNLEKLRTAPGLRVGGLTVGHTNYVAARLFASLLGVKDAKFITGFSGTADVDGALLRGELDAAANGVTAITRRNADWIEKGLMDFHAIINIPKEAKHTLLGHLPEIESFAKTPREVKLLTTWRTFRLVGSPYVAVPGTPKDRVQILEDAMRKALQDPEFHREYKKIVGDDVEPVMAEQLTKEIRDMPRDPEVIDLLKSLAGGGALPAR
jgi:tripartite-type tricarboxylate transporter receptor subunit TctC